MSLNIRRDKVLSPRQVNPQAAPAATEQSWAPVIPMHSQLPQAPCCVPLRAQLRCHIAPSADSLLMGIPGKKQGGDPSTMSWEPLVSLTLTPGPCALLAPSPHALSTSFPPCPRFCLKTSRPWGLRAIPSEPSALKHTCPHSKGLGKKRQLLPEGVGEPR